jgi:hypothetical protein
MSLYGGAKAAALHGPNLGLGHQGVGRTFNILSPGGGLMETGRSNDDNRSATPQQRQSRLN